MFDFCGCYPTISVSEILSVAVLCPVCVSECVCEMISMIINYKIFKESCVVRTFTAPELMYFVILLDLPRVKKD